VTREEELEIISRVQSGDTDAFELLVLENEKLVYNIALKMLGNEADAMDASQEVFIKAFTSISGFRGESKFSVWLYRMTNNICIDMLRRRRGETVSLSVDDGEGDSQQADIPDERFQPEEILQRKELRAAVRRGIAQLPEDYRQVLLLREIGGQTYDEIGETLGLDIGTVKSRIFRARKKLCKILSEDGNFFEKFPSEKTKGGA